ncbi:hypothetical protein Mcup_0463 [Metallosphaera cuprina Ar-4]|uniref:Uncharacterized protein n=1 Tax=Metallosphaera cuprina (strain Ar-4) TaxID=1006006 RepID=F4G071_METCR|nr:hypothetical protein Mcup_0463 [Metallosphaera cuprina Ar-4]
MSNPKSLLSLIAPKSSNSVRILLISTLVEGEKFELRKGI